MSRRTTSDPPRAAAAEVRPRRPIFTDATIRVLVRAAGKEPRHGANLGAIAARLSEAAVDYILWSRSDQHATAGKAAEWARGRATLAAEFLAGFGMSPDPGGAPARAEALAPLFEGLPPGAARREDVRRDLEAVRRLHALASAAAGTYEARKGKPREPDGPLLDLFVSVTIAYLRSVGAGWESPMLRLPVRS